MMCVRHPNNIQIYCQVVLFFFFNDTATTEIYTGVVVGSVRCVKSTDGRAGSTAAAEAAAQVGAGDDTAINRDSICRLVCDMIDEMDDGTGWVRTSRVGDQLIKRYPDFDVRNFGSKSLNKFLASFPVLEVEERTLPNGNPIQFVREHPPPKKAAPKKQNQPRKAAPFPGQVLPFGGSPFGLRVDPGS